MSKKFPAAISVVLAFSLAALGKSFQDLFEGSHLACGILSITL